MDWNIEGKRVVVTGGNAGIGRATAEELARHGADVMITARDRAKGEAAVAAIEAAAGVVVDLGELDLSSFASIRAFAARYQADHDRLHVLINNAGMMAGSRQETEDGLEWTFGVNHVGPFLLTNLLLPVIQASEPARIINLSSEAHRSAKDGLDFDDLQMEAGRFSGPRAYAASKLANISFTLELARRLAEAEADIRTVAVHPGVVATSFGTGQEGPWWMKVAMRVLKPVLRTPAKGAATSVFLATAPDAELDRALYWADTAPVDPIPPAVDPDAAARLWAESEELTGLAR